jgi:hypothetical protein
MNHTHSHQPTILSICVFYLFVYFLTIHVFFLFFLSELRIITIFYVPYNMSTALIKVPKDATSRSDFLFNLEYRVTISPSQFEEYWPLISTLQFIQKLMENLYNKMAK